MDLEDYLIEEFTPLLAIKYITETADEYIRENYYEFGHEKELLKFMDKVLAFMHTIKCLNNAMLVDRNEAKKYV